MRLVFTVVAKSGDLDIDYDKWTIPSMYYYARRMMADFRVIRTVEDPKTWEGIPTWYRISELISLQKSNVYDEILYLDADVFVHPRSDDIFIACNGYEFGWATERWCNGAVPEDHINSILSTFGEPTTCVKYHNAGVLYISKDGLSKLNLNGPYTFRNWQDQDFLNFRVSQCGLNVITMGDEWNFIPESSSQHANFYHCAFQHKHMLEKLVKHFNSVK